jgi:NAD(P)-dependent dehydrogenase (short-subunit alcohol dehydrogenase family)
MGLASALRLARGGAQVHVAGIDPDANARGAAAAQEAGVAGAVRFSQVDVADEHQVEAWVAGVMETATGIDILVNAAGIQTYGTLDTTTIADWDRVMAVNLRANFLTAHFVWPHMKHRGGGAIILISSVQGHVVQKNVLGYATTKGGVHTMTKALAVDCAAFNVRVNSISPGSIRTPLLEYGAAQLAGPDGRMEDWLEKFAAVHPIGRIGTAEEVGELVAFLASDRAGFITGADIRIDGALTAWLGV